MHYEIIERLGQQRLKLIPDNDADEQMLDRMGEELNSKFGIQQYNLRYVSKGRHPTRDLMSLDFMIIPRDDI